MIVEKPTILICNDDGVNAPGLRYLIETVSVFGNVIAVAPADHRSGQSSAITIGEPLRIVRHADIGKAEVYSVSGTPVDCIKLALHTIVAGRKISLMLSGINHGSNAGNCVVYSGTMGAAMEACMQGIPSIGYSLLHHSWEADFSQCAPFVKEITAAVLRNGLPHNVCLNVNIPAHCTPKGLKVVDASEGFWTEEYVEYKDPQGVPFYMLSGRYVDKNPEADNTDSYWLDRQFVTVVPVTVNPTASDKISIVRQILEK